MNLGVAEILGLAALIVEPMSAALILVVIMRAPRRIRFRLRILMAMLAVGLLIHGFVAYFYAASDTSPASWVLQLVTAPVNFLIWSVALLGWEEDRHFTEKGRKHHV